MNFEDITLRVETSSRGGGIEIDLTSLGFNGEKMTAFQNYLGGGMLGAITSDCTMWGKDKPFLELSIAELLDTVSLKLKEYFHSLTNPDEEYFEHVTFEQNQKMSVSAY